MILTEEDIVFLQQYTKPEEAFVSLLSLKLNSPNSFNRLFKLHIMDMASRLDCELDSSIPVLGKINNEPARIASTFVSPEYLQFTYLFSWRLDSKGYVYSEANWHGWNKRIYLHRFIMDFPEEPNVVHHVDHNKLNNTTSNLEILTRAANSKAQVGATSSFVGVIYKNGLWEARATIKDKVTIIGYFDDEVTAATIVDRVVLYYNKPEDIHHLNFPDLALIEPLSLEDAKHMSLLLS